MASGARVRWGGRYRIDAVAGEFDEHGAQVPAQGPAARDRPGPISAPAWRWRASPSPVSP